jgi:PAS domain S-box-containing protein
LFEKTFLSQRDAIFLLDAKNPPTITDCNPMAVEMFGYSRQEMLGRTTAILHVDEAALEEFRGYTYSAVEEHGFLHLLDFRMRRKDGTVFPTEHSVVPLQDGQGKRIGWVSVVRDITERKRAEEALRESEERYRTLFEQAPDSVLLIDGETGALVQFNDKAHETLGYTREELEKLKIPDFEAIESPEEVARHIRRVVKEGADIFETKHRTKSGEIRDVEVRSRAVSVRGKGFNQAIFRDISERKRAEEALRESEEKYRKLVQDSIDGIMVAEGSEIGFVNQAALKMFGYQSEEEVVGRPFTDFVSAEYREMMAERGYARDRGERGPDRYEFKALRKDGSEFDAEVSISRVGYQGKVLRQAIVRDISEHKRAEEALQKAREELESRVERRMQQANGHGLTFRELTVLHLVAAGESDKEIARVLGISPLTAHKHIANILAKMGAACRTEASVRALREGLLD